MSFLQRTTLVSALIFLTVTQATAQNKKWDTNQTVNNVAKILQVDPKRDILPFQIIVVDSQDAIATICGKASLGCYLPAVRTIYIVKNTNNGVLAHEICHHILHHSFHKVLPAEEQEIWCQYVEKHYCD